MEEDKRFVFADFLMNAPLYAPTELREDVKMYTRFLKHEAFCEFCGKEKTFVFYDLINYPIDTDGAGEDCIVLRKDVPAETLLQLECTNCGSLRTYCLKVSEGRIWKIGQNPAGFALQTHEAVKYKSELPDNHRELSYARQAFFTGSSVAAFFLGRRVFEYLLDIDYRKYFGDPEDRRISEKIGKLERGKYLLFPRDMQAAKERLFQTLDRAPVEYKEDECREMFPYLTLTIEFLADRNADERRRAQKLRDAVKNL